VTAIPRHVRSTSAPRGNPKRTGNPPRGRRSSATSGPRSDAAPESAEEADTPPSTERSPESAAMDTATPKGKPAGPGGKRPSGALLEERVRRMAALLSQGATVRQCAVALGIPLRTAERLSTKAKRHLASTTAGQLDELRGAALERARLIAREARAKGALGVALSAERFVATLLGLDGAGSPGHAAGAAASQVEQGPPPTEEQVLDEYIANTGILARWIAKQPTALNHEARETTRELHRAVEARFLEAERAQVGREPPAPPPEPKRSVGQMLGQLRAAEEGAPLRVPALVQLPDVELVEAPLSTHVVADPANEEGGFHRWLSRLPMRG
jgi:hypothetical protein